MSKAAYINRRPIVYVRVQEQVAPGTKMTMDARLKSLLAVLPRAAEAAPRDVVSFLQGLADPGALPSP